MFIFNITKKCVKYVQNFIKNCSSWETEKPAAYKVFYTYLLHFIFISLFKNVLLTSRLFLLKIQFQIPTNSNLKVQCICEL